MTDEYTSIYSLPNNLHRPGSPVVITESALVKDEDGSVFARLTFRNISKKNITDLRVKIIALDELGLPLDDVDSFSYDDLDADYGDTFGEVTYIPLPDAATKECYIEILSVFSGSDKIYETDGQTAEPAAQKILDILASLKAKPAPEKKEEATTDYVLVNQRWAKRKRPLLLAILGLIVHFLAFSITGGIASAIGNYLRVYPITAIMFFVAPTFCLISLSKAKKTGVLNRKHAVGSIIFCSLPLLIRMLNLGMIRIGRWMLVNFFPSYSIISLSVVTMRGWNLHTILFTLAAALAAAANIYVCYLLFPKNKK